MGSVLVAFATKYGSTREVAEAVAATLRERGVDVELKAKVEETLPSIRSHVRDDYESATTYHDGKWVLVEVDSAAVMRDVERLLLLKRKPPRAAR